MLNIRRLRRILRHILPEGIKKRLRARLFGYRAASVGADWSLGTRDGNVELRASGVEAIFPESARGSLMYHCFENGDSVEELHGFLNHAKCASGTLIDIGAADGLFSSLYCLAGANNRAVAYEPSVELYEHLAAIVKLNNLSDRIVAVNAAVGSSTGILAGVLNPAGMLIVNSTAPPTSQIRMVCLDDQLGELGMATAIKIDVEGYEGEVLRGAARLLSTQQPILFLEFHLDILERQGERVDELLQLLLGLGYRFESSLGVPLLAKQIATSPKAIVRFVARADYSLSSNP